MSLSVKEPKTSKSVIIDSKSKSKIEHVKVENNLTLLDSSKIKYTMNS